MKRKARILIVDDEAGFTRMLKLVVRHDIREENDSNRAFETALSFRPDLILLDVVMPGMDGGNLAAKFRADALLKHVPIVFLTAVVSRLEAGEEAKNQA